MEVVIKSSEAFLRMNSDDQWAKIGLLRWNSLLINHAGEYQQSRFNRLSRTALLIASINSNFDGNQKNQKMNLGWSIHKVEKSNREVIINPLVPDSFSGNISREIVINNLHLPVVFDHNNVWGTNRGNCPISVFTDGSYKLESEPNNFPSKSSSSWAVVVQDDWLLSNYGNIDSDENLIRSHHVAGAAAFGSSIVCSTGIYCAELQAICRAIAMFPVRCPITIYSDSKASIMAIDAYMNETNVRKKLRMSGRPFLRIIQLLIQKKLDLSLNLATVSLIHQNAHSDQQDINSVGNRIADFYANLFRQYPVKKKPALIKDFCLENAEQAIYFKDENANFITGDIRKLALKRIRWLAIHQHWKNSTLQSQFACDEMLEMGQIVMADGNRSHQTFFLILATNLIHVFFRSEMVEKQQSDRESKEEEELVIDTQSS